jgi:type II secretory pathway component GspD/PulD (secretin)
MLVTGGWPVGSGKHMFLLMTAQPGYGGDLQTVLVESHFVEVPDQALAALGLGGLAIEANKTAAQQIVSAAYAEEMLAKLKEVEGVSFTASPRVTTMDGQQATISQTEQAVVGGDTHNVGPVIKIRPRITGDGDSVELELAAEVTALVQPSGR